MSEQELLAALKQLKVQTGSLACLGCGYEHNCSTKGCAILREAIAELEKRSCPKKLYDVLFDEGFPEKSYITDYPTGGLFIAFAGDYIPVEEVGKTVFSTREEAEAVLKERLKENE